MRKITAFFLLFLLVGSSFIMFLPPISGQVPVSSEEGFIIVEDFVAGATDTQWQKDTQFTSDAKISVNGGDMVLDFDHESWQWTTTTYTNTSWVIHETRNVWGFGTIQYACNNNLKGVIKCWLRGDVSLPTDYRIGVSPGTWNPETNIYESYNQKYHFNLTDIADYGFPIAYDEDTSQLVIGVSGTFDIDPTITQAGERVNYMNNDVTVTVGHFDYVFYKSGDWLQYMYKNSSELGWYNGSKIWAVNRTEYIDRPNGVLDTAVGGAFPHSWKTNGTHIYGAVASNKYTDGNIGNFLLFNVTQLNDAHNATGYNVGSLVLHTNASLPCLGDAQYAGNCGVWANEWGVCAADRCFVDVNMNSSGFPMVIYSTDREMGGNTPPYAPSMMILVAENPVGATCTEKSDFSQRPCNQNDARNGKNGTWTQPYQVAAEAQRDAGGTGARYTWFTTASSAQYQWEGNTCSMGNGNMLMIWHNRTASNSNDGQIWGRFWYQANATWGSEFGIFTSLATSRPITQKDDIDLTCTPDSSGTMTAHIAFTSFHEHSASNRTGGVAYINLTSASYTAVSWSDSVIVRQFPLQSVHEWATDVQIAADNSTGTIGIFYMTNRGDVYYNFTGYYGTQGFGKTKGLQTQQMCGYTGGGGAGESDNDPLGSRFSVTTGMFMNGTATDSSMGAFLSFACVNHEDTLLYTHWLNATVVARLSFYHPDGTLVQVQNMTFTSRSNGSELAVIDCSICVTQLNTGTYDVDGIFLNNVDMEINGTEANPSFYIDLANNTASFIVGNMSVTFVFKDEVTLEDWDVSDRPLKIDMWTLSNTKENQTTIDETGDLKQFVSFTPARVKVSFGDSYQYYRWDAQPNGCLTAGCDTIITFYLPDYDRFTVTEYTWNFVDQTQQYTNGTVLFRKYISTGLIQIGQPELSVPDNQVKFFGILNHEYTISVFSNNNIRRSDIGIWTAESTPTTINANIEASALFNDIALSQNYVLFQAKRTVCTAEDIRNIQNQCSGSAFGGAAHSNITIYWKDIQNETSTVTFEIFNRTGLQYTTTLTGNPAETLILWQGADTNISHTYWVKMTATSSRFGSIVETRPAEQAGLDFGPMIPIGRCTVVCDGSLLSNFSPYYVYISMILLIFTVGMFSQATAAIGGIITVMVANMLYFFGWLPGMSPLILAVITLLSFIYLFAVAKGR